ncbi:PREDICTED: interleukin-6-like [Elephantulus edwardii]|uniref:interleukin-6-like n=1 Tax=Elephantulus edwardii TaxID=28737 RepID=UPI0003F0E4F5|nr:PREDICTED: interleukin-6-like [Elephantulus edwardii]
MNSLSTSAFGPVAFSLGLLLVMASAFPCRTPPGGDSKEDATSNTPQATISDKTKEFMKFIIDQISALKKEMCEKYDKCENNEILAGNNMNLPKITKNDGCFISRFSQETCLTRIVTGLLEFQIYLDYIQNKFEGSKEKVTVVQRSTKTLVQILKPKVKNPVTTPNPTTNASLLSKLQPQSEWLRNTRINLILQSLDIFMQFSLRAIHSGHSSLSQHHISKFVDFHSLIHPPKMPKGKKAKGKKVTPAPAVVKKKEIKKVVNPFFKKRRKNFGIGHDIQPKRDLTHFVKWPHYIQLQQQKVNTITTLVEKAQQVVIAHDMDPIELVVFLPALCQKMGVPYCITKGKARLGPLFHRKA